MAQYRIWTFFYGSFINLDVLKGLGVVPEHCEVGKLVGFDISIEPLANLIRADNQVVYGILATTTHEELDRLYAHAQDVLGGQYLPEAVLVEASDGRQIPALCYIARTLDRGPADDRYIDKIVSAATAFGFPASYIRRIESFRP